MMMQLGRKQLKKAYMITIATYRNLMSAELAKTRLASCDIEATIADASSYILGYGSVIDGVRLQVPDEDTESARAILAATDVVELPDNGAGIDEPTEPAAPTTSNRARDWSAFILFVSGVLCLILGRPTDDWDPLSPVSGQLIFAGEILMIAGLWIAYGSLSSTGENDAPPESKPNKPTA